LTVDECFDDIKSSGRLRIPEKCTIEKWYRQFRRTTSSPSLNKTKRRGRPSLNRLPQDIQRVLKADPDASAKQIAPQVKAHRTTVSRVIKQTLHLKKLPPRRIPHELKDWQRKQRLKNVRQLREELDELNDNWEHVITLDETIVFLRNPTRARYIRPGKRRPIEVRQGPHDPKVMITVAFSSTKIWAVYVLQAGKTMNAVLFRDTVLTPLVKLMREEVPKGDLPYRLHFDNAPPHRARIIAQFLEEHGVHRIPHPANSPDLAPCDYFLFSRLKHWLPGKVFKTSEDCRRKVADFLKHVDSSELEAAIIRWAKRCSEVIHKQGRYI
jgi:histone-lysine N-methyltransferase SETMAR